MDEKTTQFLPFHAINEFMRDDYRMSVIRSTLSTLPGASKDHRDQIEKLTKKFVQIPGFRISTKAPVSLRLKPTIDAFEKRPQLVSAIMAAWSENHSELRSQVYELLVSRGWEVLPADADRTKLPGFIPVWPKDEDFEKLTLAFKEKYPSIAAEDDDISLMVVWVSGRLPYESASGNE
jgi:hypothetical protein